MGSADHRKSNGLAERAPRLWIGLNTARLEILGPLRFGGAVCRGPKDRGAVALTFDDGPDERFTPSILDALERAKSRATFFFSGAAIERFPALARRAAANHEIGTHLYAHDRAHSRSLSAFETEVRRTLEVHERVLGMKPRALRFPFGDAGKIRRADLARWDLTAYHWTFSSEDASAASSESVVSHVVPRLHPGAIVLFHDGRGPGSSRGSGSRQPTVEALPAVLRAVADRGLRAVTLRDLFT